MLSHERLKEVLDYDPETGISTWLVDRRGTARAGARAGCIHTSHGYRQLRIDGKNYLEHRVIFFWMTGKWPDQDVDHRDMDKLNNRWHNLREATRSQNAANRRTHKTNTSGVKGVCWNKRLQKWVAQIKVNGTQIHLLATDSKEKAEVWYKAFAELAFGEYARSN